MTQNVQQILEKYLAASIAHGWQTHRLGPGEGGSIRKANAALKRQMKARKELWLLGEAGHDAVRSLMTHDDAHVRYSAARDLFLIDRATAIKVLKSISDGEYGVTSVYAASGLIGEK